MSFCEEDRGREDYNLVLRVQEWIFEDLVHIHVLGKIICRKCNDEVEIILRKE